MNAPQTDRYAVQYGPYSQDQHLQTIIATTPFMSRAWAELFCRPLDGLIHDPSTGYPHAMAMQWQLYDLADEKKLLTVFSMTDKIEGKTGVYAQYDDNLVLATDEARQTLASVPRPPALLHLATFDHATNHLALHTAYLYMAQVGLAHFTNHPSLEQEYPYTVRYETLRAGPGHKQHHAIESHYFHNRADAVAALLTVNLSKLSEARVHPDDPLVYSRMVLSAKDNERPLLRILPGDNDHAYLLAEPNFKTALAGSGQDLSTFPAFDPALPQLQIGKFTYHHHQDIQPNDSMQALRQQLAGQQQLRDGWPGHGWAYQINYKYAQQKDRSVPLDHWTVCHEQQPTIALRRLLQIDLAKLHGEFQYPVEANIANADKTYAASLVGIPKGVDRKGGLMAEYRLYLEPAFVQTLPLQVRRHIPDSPFLYLGALTEGTEQWSAKALQLRSELFLYDQTRQGLQKAGEIPQWIKGTTEETPYLLEMQQYPMPYHFLEQRPAPLTHQYPFKDFDDALQAISALKPSWFILPPVREPDRMEYTSQITLLNGQTRQPLLTASLAENPIPGTGKHVLVVAADKALSPREADRLRTLHDAITPNKDLRFSWSQEHHPHRPVSPLRQIKSALDIDGAKHKM